MKLNNRDLVLRGFLRILPTHLERYLRAALGERCTPEVLRPLLTGDGPVPEFPDLANLPTQIRILTARGDDGRYLLDLPPGLGDRLSEVGRLRDELVRGGDFDAAGARAALAAAGEVLGLIGAEFGQAEIRELVDAIDGGQGVGRTPLDTVGVEVACVPVVSYAHAVASAAPTVSIRLSLPQHVPGSGAHASGSGGGAFGPDASAADGQQRKILSSGACGGQEPPSGVLEVTLTLIEDDGGREVAESWHLTWDTSSPVLTGTRALALDRENLLQVSQPGSAHVRVELRAADGTQSVRRLPGLTVLPPRQWRVGGGE